MRPCYGGESSVYNELKTKHLYDLAGNGGPAPLFA